MSARLRKGTDQDPSADLENVNAACQAMREERDRAVAEAERLREALRQIADGEVRPQPDESGWFSVANGVRMLACAAIAPPSEERP